MKDTTRMSSRLDAGGIRQSQCGRVALAVLLILSLIGLGVLLYPPTRSTISGGAHALQRLATTGSTAPLWQQERDRLRAEYAADVTQADVVIFGDSLAANGAWQRVAPGKVVLNRGIGGDTINAMLGRLDTVMAANPDVVVLFRAHSDLEHHDASITELDVDARIADANRTLEAMISRVQNAGAKVVLVDIPLIGVDGPFNAAIAKLNAAERRVAARLGVLTVQVSGPLSTNGKLRPEYTTDGTHLSKAGYAVVLPRVAAAVNVALNS